MNFSSPQFRYLKIVLKTTSNVNVLNQQCNFSTLLNSPQSRKKPHSSVRLQLGDRRTFIGHVPDRKEGYRTQKEETYWQHTRFGFGLLKNELKMWIEEWKEKIKSDIQLLPLAKGEIDALYEFGKPGEIEKFIVTSDSDHNQGFSRCSFTINENGYGLFSGVLDSTVPQVGNIERAGYCNITSLHPKKSFQRDISHDWSMYNMLVLRIRGDGRAYAINLHVDGYFDIQWHDIYTYVLYTRGGPHWQVAKIPFSKFFLSAKGYVQDKQSFMPNVRVGRIGITAAGMDHLDGEFNLELDYIGLEFNQDHKEEFAYELYKMPDFVVGT